VTRDSLQNVNAALRAKGEMGILEAKRTSSSRWRCILRAVLSYNWPRKDFSGSVNSLGELWKVRLPAIETCREHCRRRGQCLRLHSGIADSWNTFPDMSRLPDANTQRFPLPKAQRWRNRKSGRAVSADLGAWHRSDWPATMLWK